MMQFKCEYVDELAQEPEGALRNNTRLTAALHGAYREAPQGQDAAPPDIQHASTPQHSATRPP